MKKYKVDLLIFDLDGTLIDSSKSIAKTINFIRNKSNLPPLPISQIISCVGSGTDFLLEKTVGDGEYKEKLKLFYDYYGRHLMDDLILYPGVKEILEFYKDKRKVVISNKNEIFSKIIISNLGIDKYFELIIGANSFNLPKPNPDSIFRITKILEVQPQKTVIIGDGISDILAAKASKIISCAVGYGFAKKEQLISYSPDIFISHLKELPCYIE